METYLIESKISEIKEDIVTLDKLYKNKKLSKRIKHKLLSEIQQNDAMLESLNKLIKF